MPFSLICLGLIFISPINLRAQILEEGGGKVECFSQSYTQPDFDYYDCGSCSKIDGRRGYGNTNICTT
jgi:hypothetical protein